MADLTSIVGNLDRLGFYDFVLPWLLFFALIRAIVDKSGVVGTDAKINSIIAAVIAFFVVNFTPVGGISAYYSTLFGSSAMILATLLVFVLFTGVLGLKPKDLIESGDEKHKKWIYPLLAIILAVFAFGVFTQSTGGISTALGLDSDTITLILIGIFVVAIISFAWEINE